MEFSICSGGVKLKKLLTKAFFRSIYDLTNRYYDYKLLVNCLRGAFLNLSKRTIVASFFYLILMTTVLIVYKLTR